MEGTWGRRVFGTIQKGPEVTRFELYLALRDGIVVGSVIYVTNIELETGSGVYKEVLDQMVDGIQKGIASLN